ncbi:hypothetical protein DXG03_006239 [Asterophora parasitica]|uniref:Peroxisomal ATPase PEX1 n=1 Tax=Asterophora parasitica TaxID=117018 RepID=A0A9P7GDN4_9AGAR|nr:hypothetical protein DXG03_006239 [Asterophora parasitica]
MPDLEERKDILRAVGQRVSLSPSVDLSDIAAATDGFSGADLQALVYNAHLETIHASIASASNETRTIGTLSEEEPIEFIAVGGSSTAKVSSKAERSALEKRLRQIKQVSKTQVGSVKAEAATTKKKV